MRSPFMLVAALGALLVLAAPAAAPTGRPGPPLVGEQGRAGRRRGAGADGAQVGGKLQETVDVGRVVFNLPLPAPYWYFLPRDRAFGALFSSARRPALLGAGAGAAAESRCASGAAKGTITHLDEYQAYEKRAGDASLRITISDVLLQTIDDNNRPRGVGVPGGRRLRAGAHGRAVPRPRVRRLGGRRLLRPPAAPRTWRAISTPGGPARRRRRTLPGRCGARTHFDVDGDADDSGTGAAGGWGSSKPRSLQVPLGSVRAGRAVRRARQPRGRGGRRPRRRVRRPGLHPGPAEARAGAVTPTG